MNTERPYALWGLGILLAAAAVISIVTMTLMRPPVFLTNLRGQALPGSTSPEPNVPPPLGGCFWKGTPESGPGCVMTEGDVCYDLRYAYDDDDDDYTHWLIQGSEPDDCWQPWRDSCPAERVHRVIGNAQLPVTRGRCEAGSAGIRGSEPYHECWQQAWDRARARCGSGGRPEPVCLNGDGFLSFIEGVNVCQLTCEIYITCQADPRPSREPEPSSTPGDDS
jgi:hypothetical protein